MTAPATLLDATGRRIVVQDSSAAVEILLPTGTPAPAVGSKIRAEGRIGVAYGAPRLRADKLVVTGNGSAAGPGDPPRFAGRGAGVAARGGDRAGGRAPPSSVTAGGPRSRSARPRSWSSVSQVPGSRARRSRSAGRATVIGIARRPYPSATDRRYAVTPRSPADVRVAGRADADAAAATGSSGGTTSPATTGAPGARRPPHPTPTSSTSIRGSARLVRVGGLVVDLRARWLHARRRHRDRPGRPARPGARAAGPHRARRRAQRDRSGGSRRRPAPSSSSTIRRASSRPATPSPRRQRASSEAAPGPSTAPSGTPGTLGGAAGRLAGLGGTLPFDAGTAGLGTLAAISAASVAVTLLRRAYSRDGVCPPGSPVDWPRSRPPPETRPEGRRRRAWLSVGQARSTRLDARENAGLSSAEFRASEAAT